MLGKNLSPTAPQQALGLRGLCTHMMPFVIYSEDRNLILPVIFKNCSSSLESWLSEHGAQQGFEIIEWTQADQIIQDRNPQMISILRDPVSRVLSAIRMQVQQLVRSGLSEVSWENFRNLHRVSDPHLIPQSVFVPQRADRIRPEPNMQIDYYPTEFLLGPSWHQVLSSYDVLARITEHNVFFYMKSGGNLMADLGNYLQIDSLKNFWSNYTILDDLPESLLQQPDSEYINYVKQVYQYDYDLINSVNFENHHVQTGQ